ncbi:MAG: sigma-70 family RNA polymerase sigma factor [Chitinophagaceae bacterium]
MINKIHTDWNDDLLISSLAQGDQQAFKHIYNTYYNQIERMVFKMNGNTDDAFDVFQDTITVLYEKVKGSHLELNVKFSTYLIAIAKKMWLKKLVKNKKHTSNLVLDEESDFIDVNQDLSVFFEYEQHAQNLKHCLSIIGESCQKLLTLFYMESKSLQEISEILNYSNPENAKTQKYKCINRLRKLFFKQQEINGR